MNNNQINSISSKFDGIASSNIPGIGILNAIENGIRTVFSVTKQNRFMKTFGNAIDTTYNKISNVTNGAHAKLESARNNSLRAPIEAMKDLKISPLQIKEFDSNASLKKVVNKLRKFHEQVVVKGEAFSREAGQKTDNFIRFALTPITFVAKLLKIEVAGKLIQDSVAITVGFAVRGIVLAISQLAHIAPYALAAATIGAAGLGLAALAVKVSPLAAVAVALAVVMTIQQVQISSLGKDALELRKQNSDLNKNLEKLNDNLVEADPIENIGRLFQERPEKVEKATFHGLKDIKNLFKEENKQEKKPGIKSNSTLGFANFYTG